MYPVTGVPPVLVGAIHLRLICDDDIAFALSEVGLFVAVHVVA